ncbi:MAG: GAF domain-containing protein [Oscillatoria princeps RMCB-10]|jgi:signal transduction histidine kinase|nr:GAF domain-containing protein [Oscillatoria princeps RMCB-10]
MPGFGPDPERDEGQAALAQLQQQVELSRLLNQINNQIRSTLDLEEVLNSACRLLGIALNCSRVSILVKESSEAETLTTKGEYNRGEYPVQLDVEVPVADNAHLQVLMAQPEPLAVTRFLEFPGLGEGTKELVKALGIRSMLAVATRYQGRVNGVIGLHQCDREREWTDWERQLLEGVACPLAIAINQALLYRESRRQAERESLLRLVIQQIRSTLDLKTILQTAVRGVRELLDTDRVAIYQFKEDWQGTVVVEDVISPWLSVLGDMGADDCFSGKYAHLYEEGRVRAIHDIHSAGLDPCHVKFLQRLQVRANLIVPVVIGEKLWGLLIAHECRSTRRWQSCEIDLLRDLADQIAIAIGQAELYSQVQDTAAKYQAQAERLQATLEELRSTQLQLIQSEKMSSLGQMVAGIAHEINNANNFIHANLPHAREYAETLSEGIDCMAEACPEAAAALARFNDEVELDYIREDFPKMLESMEEGSGRILEIVRLLRNFCRLDEAEFKAVDLHEGIESSLAMLQHRLKSGVNIRKEYGKLPPVFCCAGHINQVFFNLLNNALDAVEATGSSGEVTVRTQATESDSVTVSIRDRGVGVAPEIQERIFDPFFTTKPVGQGTGLGLSICYQVIVKGHGGRIRCVSQPGEGAEFIVELPVGSNG